MTKATINNQHDYITLRIRFDDGTKLNITKSFSGMKLSGDHANKDGLNFFSAYLKQRGKGEGRTLGTAFEELRIAAAKSTDILSFLDGLRQA